MQMAQKQEVVADLSAKLSRAKCLYLTDFTGLDVAAITELRRRLTNAGVEYLVVKNTLARRALSGGPYEGLTGHLAGPNAFALSDEDAACYAANSFTLTQGGASHLVMPGGVSERLQAEVRERGVEPVVVDVSEFLKKGGGSVKCMIGDLGPVASSGSSESAGTSGSSASSSEPAWTALRGLGQGTAVLPASSRREVRQTLGQTISYVLARPPRLLRFVDGP